MLRVLFLIICLAGAVPAHALRYMLTPSLGLGGTFDDRVREDRQDWCARLTPGVLVDVEQDRYRARAEARIGVHAYQKYTEYDRLDQDYLASIDYGWSARLRLGLSGKARLDTDYEDEYEEGRVVDVEATDRRTFTLSPSVSYLLSPRDTLAIAYSVAQRENEADYNADYLGHVLGATWTHQYSEILDLFIRANAQRTMYDGSRSNLDSSVFGGELTQDTVSLMGGVSYRPSERLSLTLALGGGDTHTRRRDSEWDLGLARIALGDGETTSSLNYLVNSGLEWTGERFSVTAGYDRDIYSSAEGEDVVRDSVNAGIAYRITPLASIGVSALARHLADNSDRDERDDWYHAVNPYVRFQISKDSSVRFGYAYSQSHEKDEERAVRNRCSLDYVMSFPLEY